MERRGGRAWDNYAVYKEPPQHQEKALAKIAMKHNSKEVCSEQKNAYMHTLYRSTCDSKVKVKASGLIVIV